MVFMFILVCVLSGLNMVYQFLEFLAVFRVMKGFEEIMEDLEKLGRSKVGVLYIK